MCDLQNCSPVKRARVCGFVCVVVRFSDRKPAEHIRGNAGFQWTSSCNGTIIFWQNDLKFLHYWEHNIGERGWLISVTENRRSRKWQTAWEMERMGGMRDFIVSNNLENKDHSAHIIAHRADAAATVSSPQNGGSEKNDIWSCWEQTEAWLMKLLSCRASCFLGVCGCVRLWLWIAGQLRVEDCARFAKLTNLIGENSR